MTTTNILEEPKCAEPGRPFDQNIEGAIVRLQVASGQAIFCDAVVLTEYDLVVTIPAALEAPGRGENVRCSIFLLDDESYVAHRDGIIHWEMGLHRERLVAVFLQEPSPERLLELTVRDQRREVRFPASLVCTVESGGGVAFDGRMMNYSLNGVAAQLAEPLEIGDEYTVCVEAGEDALQLAGTCRWNIETPHGFVNGFSLEHHQGKLLAKSAFLGTARLWDIQPAASVVAIHPLPTRRKDPVVVSRGGSLKPVLTRTTILVLSLVLIWFAARIHNQMTGMTFLTGCIGLLTYIGLDWTSKVHQARRRKQLAEKNQSHAESRLHAHLARQRAVPEAAANSQVVPSN